MSQMKEYLGWVEDVIQKFASKTSMHPDDALNINCKRDLIKDYLENTNPRQMASMLISDYECTEHQKSSAH